MLIRNSRSMAETEAQRMLAMKLLEIEASNEAYLDKVKSAYKDPKEGPKVPPRYRDASEIAADIFGNQIKLINLLSSWRINPQDANAVVKDLSPDDVIKLLSAQNNFKVKLDGFNKEMLEPRFISNIIEKFLSEYDRTLGGSFTSVADLVANSYGTVKNLFPTKEQVERLESKLRDVKQAYEAQGVNAEEIIRTINSIQTYKDLYDRAINNNIKGANADVLRRELKDLLDGGKIPPPKVIEQNIAFIDDVLKGKTGINMQEMNANIETIKNSFSDREFLRSLESIAQKHNIQPGENILSSIDEKLYQHKRDIWRAQQDNSDLELKRKEDLENTYLDSGGYMEGNPSPYDVRAITGNYYYSSTNRIPKNDIKDFYNDMFIGGYFNIIDIIDDYQKKTGKSVNIENVPEHLRDRVRALRPPPKNVPRIVMKKRITQAPTIVDINLAAKELDDQINLGKMVNPQAMQDSKEQIDATVEFLISGEERKDIYDEYVKQLYDEITYKLLKEEGEETLLEEELKQALSGEKSAPPPVRQTTAELNEGLDKDLSLLEMLSKKGKEVIEGMTRKKSKVVKKTTRGSEKEGSGFNKNNLGFLHKKIRVGKGIEQEEKPKFVQFGKYLLNQPHLYNDSKLTLRFKSGGAIPTIKPAHIGEDFREFLIDLIENEKISQPLHKSLSTEEKAFFEKICKGAGLINKLKIKPNQCNTDKSETEELNRYKLLIGEIEAGNNNKDVIKELRALVLKFMKSGRMSKADGSYILTEIGLI